MISLKKVYMIFKENTGFFNGCEIYTKDGKKAEIAFHRNADFKQVVNISDGTYWYEMHASISSIYTKYFFEERFIIKRVFDLYSFFPKIK